MKLSLHKIGVLLKKESKDLLRNSTVAVLIIMPIAMTFLFKFMFESSTDGIEEASHFVGVFVLSFATSMAIAVIPGSVLPTTIAEEKEKKTLRTLMLADVNGVEFLISKALIVFLLLLFTLIVIFFITGVSLSVLPMYLLTCIIASISILLIGSLIGLMSKNQMTSGVISAPIMMVLMLMPMMQQFDPILAKIAFFVPTTSVGNVLEIVLSGSYDWGAILPNYAVMFGWIIVSIILFLVMFKKLEKDN